MFILISHFSSAVDGVAMPKTGEESLMILMMIYEVVLEAASPALHIKHPHEIRNEGKAAEKQRVRWKAGEEEVRRWNTLYTSAREKGISFLW